jgi:5-hydroxyisourate hydrolase-like protein (transthyretin family)
MKISRYKHVLSLVVAAIILAAIFVPFQRVNAFTFEMSIEDEIGRFDEGTEFAAVLDIKAGEFIPVNGVTIALDGGEHVFHFDQNGNLISGDSNIISDITITPFFDHEYSYGYGYGYYGFGYGYGYGSVSDYHIGYGYSYGYDFSYSYDYIGLNRSGPDRDCPPSYDMDPEFPYSEIPLQFIHETGVEILSNVDDSVEEGVPIGFDFPFFGSTYSSVSISSNGMIFFGEPTSQYSNEPIGDSSPSNFIAPFWDDLVTYDDNELGAVYYETIGEAPNRVFWIQYHDVGHYSARESGGLWWVRLFESTGQILFNYGDTSFGYPEPSNYDDGASATVGIEGPDGTGVQYSYNEPIVNNGRAIMFTLDPCDTGYSKFSGGYFGPATIVVSGFLHTSELDSGMHSIQASIDTGASRNGHLISTLEDFEIVGDVECDEIQYGRGAIIGNGDVILGVDCAGQLNVQYREVPELGLPEFDPAGIYSVGLRDGSGEFASTEPGCVCEGWGVAIDDEISGFANNALGSGGIEVENFIGEDGGTEAISIVKILGDDGHHSNGNGHGRDDAVARVTHHYAPSSDTDHLYEVTVTIENLSNEDFDSVVYRRVMDWDITPTVFHEFVTISGTASTDRLLNSGNNGFLTGDPLVNDPEDFVIFPEDVSTAYLQDLDHSGPADHGSVFDFEAGPIARGESATLTIFYGNAPDEAETLDALVAVEAELFSIGQSTIDSYTEDERPDIEGEQGPTFAFGFAGVGGEAAEHKKTITIIKFNDRDQDGVQDNNEEGLAGFEFEIRDADGDLLATVTSNSAGRATFTITDLEEDPAPYTVTELEREGSEPTTPTSVQVGAVPRLSTVKFGNVLSGTIEGIKFEDENGNGHLERHEDGIEDVEIQLYVWNGTQFDLLDFTFTDEDGRYSFSGLEEGFYEVRVVEPEGFITTSPFGGSWFLFVSSGDVLTNINFGDMEEPETSISGIKYEDLNGNGRRNGGEPGIANVTIFLIGIDPFTGEEVIVGETETDEDGEYSFEGVSPGRYIVEEDLDDLDNLGLDPVNPPLGFFDIFVGFDDEIEGLDFGNAPRSGLLSGIKFSDLDSDGRLDDGEPGIGGTTIVVEKRDRVTEGTFLIAEIVTEEDGSWELPVSPGVYEVSEIVPEGLQQTKPRFEKYIVAVRPDEVITDLDFGNAAPQPSDITGTKYEDLNGNGERDEGEPGLANVTIYMWGAGGYLVDTTDENGDYAFEDLSPGIYYIWEDTPPGYVLTDPASDYYGGGYHTVVISPTVSDEDNDFGNAPLPTEPINGTKIRDVNGNGIFDNGDEPIAGFPICIYDFDVGEECVETDQDGRYSFGERPSVRWYYVYEKWDDLLDFGLVSVTPQYGYYVGFLNPGGTFFDWYTGVELSSEEINFFNTSGEGSINGTKWKDEDGDGIRDAGEDDVEADIQIDVYRIDPTTGALIYVTTEYTDQDGKYSVTDLPPGQYRLEMRLPFGTIQTYPANGNPQFVTLGLNENREGVDFGNQDLPPGIVEVVKINDVDRDGEIDPGEGIMSGVDICVGSYYVYTNCQNTNNATGGVLTYEANGFAWVWEYVPLNVTAVGSYIVREDGTIENRSTSPYQFFEIASNETVTVYIFNKELEPIPEDVTIPGAPDYNGDGQPEQVRGRDMTIEKDLTALLDQTLKTVGDIVSVVATVTLDDGTSRSVELTRVGETNVYRGTIPGPFGGSSVRLSIHVDFSPEGDGVEDAVENGDIVLIDPAGTIFDRITGDPIEGATVSLLRDSGAGFVAPFLDADDDDDNDLIDPDTNPQITAEDGAYSWIVAAGIYQVTAIADGYEPADSEELTIPPAQSGVDIYLLPEDAELTYELVVDEPEIIIDNGITASVETNDKAVVRVMFEWFNEDDALVEMSTVVPSDSGEAEAEIEPDEIGTWTVKATFFASISDQRDELDDFAEITSEEIEFDVGAVIGEGRPGAGGGGALIPLDRTFPASYFETNPLAKFDVSRTNFLTATGSAVSKASVGQQIGVSTTFTNQQRVEQTFAYIVQIIDEDGYTIDILLQRGTVDSGDTVTVSNMWIAQNTGDYRFQIFMWDSLSLEVIPLPLTDAEEAELTVEA